jgi:hypothetical protein
VVLTVAQDARLAPTLVLHFDELVPQVFVLLL